MVAASKVKTNWLLLDDLEFWDEFTTKAINDPDTEDYFKQIDQAIDDKLAETIKWLDSDEAKEYFQQEAEYQEEVFEALEDKWDNILSGEIDSVDELLDRIYEHGKQQGYSEIRERIRYTDADRQALQFAKDYNFQLIQKLDDNLRDAVKNRVIQAVASGEHPYELAPKIQELGVQPLPGSTLSARHRAVMIARTETARVQNTGIIQSYVNEGFTEVNILTAEDSSVCRLCLANAYEFNTDEIILENRGADRTHKIADMNSNSWVPLHPNCRCTYVVVWDSRGEAPENPMFMDFTPKHGEQGYSGFDGDWSKESVKNSLKNVVDEEDIETVAEILIDYRRKVKGKDNEHLTTTDANFNILSDAVTDFKKKEVGLPEKDRNAVKNSYFGLTIHNHPSGMPLPHYKDLETGIKNNKVKYNIIYSSNGFIVIKNKHYDNKGEIDESRYDKLERDYYDAFDERKQYINELTTRKKEEYKKSTDINRISYVEYSKEINDIEWNVEWNTLEEQVNIFNKHLGKYGVQITFIKPKV